MLKRARLCLLALAWLAAGAAADDPATEFGASLHAMRAFAGTEGDKIWPGYGEAPFGFLLISATREYLMCQKPLPDGFVAGGVDPITGCERATRSRSGLPDQLLASMPIFGEHETIVMGTPASTGRWRGDWLRTILHEHFHQYQATFAGYYPRISALGLRANDADSQWMLAYPFPYADAKVGTAYAAASIALADALAARGSPQFLAAYDRYLAARGQFEHAVSPRDWRYLEFELWKEGVARWTEIALGERYPDPDVRRESEALKQRTLAKLRAPDLKTQGRELVYPYAAAEAMLMDACGPNWRKAYPSVLAMGPLLTEVRRTCRQ